MAVTASPTRATTLSRVGDDMMLRVQRGIELGQRGDREAARQVLGVAWNDLESDGDPLHRCAVAHAMADVQDDVRDELQWDLRALAAVHQVSDARITEAGIDGSVRGFYPSLHLNLADAYHRLGEASSALEHVQLGLAALGGLSPNGYLDEIRASLERIQRRLSA